MNLKYCLSFDVGGTFIKYAVIDNEGKIHLKNKIKTPGFPCNETIPEAMLKVYKELQVNHKFDCIGISTAGQVNWKKGSVHYATDTLPNYTGTDFTEAIGNKLELPLFVDNDVNSAAIGEMWMGSAKDTKNFLCLTLGTGVGGAICVDGKIYRGENFSAGEVGHFAIVPNGDKCTCGLKGCYERYASTSALIRMYTEEVSKKYGNNNEFTGEYIIDLYFKGDEIANKVYNEFLDNIAYGLANLSHILDPGVIIVGGGISAQGKPFFDEINMRFKKFALPAYAKNTVIKQAILLNDAGVIGAAFNSFSLIK